MSVAASQRRKIGEGVDEVRRGSMCHNCRMVEHHTRDCRRKGKGGDGGKGYAKGKVKTTKGTGKKGSGKNWRIQGRTFRKTKKIGDADSAGRAARPDTSHQNVEVDEEHADSRKSGGQVETEKYGGSRIESGGDQGSKGNPRFFTHTLWLEDGPDRPPWGPDPSSGQVKIDVMNCM